MTRSANPTICFANSEIMKMKIKKMKKQKKKHDEFVYVSTNQLFGLDSTVV